MKSRILLLATAAFFAAEGFAAIPEGFDTTTKWYTTFTNADSEFEWPAGCTYGSAINYKNNGTDSNPLYGVYSNTDPDDYRGFFITPKLRAVAGEKLVIESRCNSAYSSTDGINVYISTTREGLSNPETRTPILQLATSSADPATKLTTTVQQFETIIPQGGEYYIGFSSYNRGQINGIYGCELVEMDHDWSIFTGDFPATAVQNHETTGYVNIVNFGIRDELASEYTVTVEVDGKTTILPGEVNIAAEHSLSGTGVSVPVKFRSPKVGTVSANVTVTANDGYSVSAGPIEVEIVKETLNSEVVVGIEGTTSSNVPFAGIYDNSETLSLYTPQMLGLQPGDKIKSIVLKGYVEGNVVGTQSNMKLCYQWTDATSLDKPTAVTVFDSSAMTEIYNNTYDWTAIGSKTDLQPVVVMNFAEPLVYEEGKSLMLLFHNERAKYKSGTYIECSDSNPKTSWTQKADNPSSETGVFKGNWNSVSSPTLHIILDVTPRSISGSVSALNERVADAVITLVSTDGDDVEYEGISDENGNFAIDVIQSDRTYDLEISADGFGEYAEDLSFAENSIVRDFNLRRIVRIANDATHAGGDENAIVHLDKDLTPGFNMISLPIELTNAEFKELFGEDASVFTYSSDNSNPEIVAVNFIDYEGDLMAGHPYLIKVSAENVSGFWRSRRAIGQLNDIEGTDVCVKSTNAPVEVVADITPVTEDIFLDYPDESSVALSSAGGVNIIPAYSGYLEPKPGTTGNIKVTFNGKNISVGIQNIVTDESDSMMIFDLQGRRVQNPTHGIYVVNGKLVIMN